MYERQRQDLIETLIKKGITDKAVLRAMNEVERHQFVLPMFITEAYEDKALPIEKQQTISQPYTVAFMTQELKITPGKKILEIGTGSGYQAAILDKMKAKVYSIERDMDIYLKTQKLFDKLNIRVHCKFGDGTIGWDEFAPYEGIIVTAGSPDVPPALLKQLAIGGILVIPVGDKKSQDLKIITKIAEDKFEQTEVPSFRFVPLIGRNGWVG